MSDSMLKMAPNRYIVRKEQFQAAITSCVPLDVIAVKANGDIVHTQLNGYIISSRLVNSNLFMYIDDGKGEIEVNLI